MAQSRLPLIGVLLTPALAHSASYVEVRSERMAERYRAHALARPDRAVRCVRLDVRCLDTFRDVNEELAARVTEIVSELSQLRTLVIRDTVMSVEALDHALRTGRSIGTLRWLECELSGGGAAIVTALFDELDLRGVKLADEGLVDGPSALTLALGKPKLVFLSLKNLNLAAAELLRLAACCDRLRYLALEDVTAVEDGLRNLIEASGATLREVVLMASCELGSSTVAEPLIDAIFACPQMRALAIGDEHIGDRSFSRAPVGSRTLHVWITDPGWLLGFCANLGGRRLPALRRLAIGVNESDDIDRFIDALDVRVHRRASLTAAQRVCVDLGVECLLDDFSHEPDQRAFETMRGL